MGSNECPRLRPFPRTSRIATEERSPAAALGGRVTTGPIWNGIWALLPACAGG